MKSLIRLALILAGSAAIPICVSAQAQDGRVMTPPASAAVTPAAVSPDGPGPKIQFNTEIYAAGTNMVGDPIRYTFVVTNTGDETLVISNVLPSCGCTTVGGPLPVTTSTSGGGTVTLTNATWTHEIAPGQTGIIPIQVLTTALNGAINKTIRVVSNDRARPNVVLQINGVVWQPIEIAPSALSFTFTPGSTNLNKQVVKIFNRMDGPLVLSDPRSTTNVYSPVLKTNIPGREFELTVTAVPPASLLPSLNSILIQGDISLTCSMTNRNPLTIPVFGTVPVEITVLPSSIQLPAGPLAQPSISHIRIRDVVTNITLSDPAASAPGVEVSLSVLQTNHTYELQVVFPRDFVAQPGQNVTIKTDSPRFPTLTIPITPQPGLAQPRPPVVLPPPASTGLPAPANASMPISVGSPAGLPAPPVVANTPGPSPTRLPVPPGAALANASNNPVLMPPVPPMPPIPPKP